MELAVFGAVALAALGFLIRIGMKMNYDQDIRMAAFRKGLAAARADNGTNQDSLGVVYHYIANRQMPNPTDGFMTLPRTRTEATAFVEWGDRFTMAYRAPIPGSLENGRKTTTRYVVRSDGVEQTFRGSDFPYDYVFAGRAVDSFEGIVREFSTTNTTSGGINYDPGGTSAGSTTTTCATSTVNTNAGDTVGSCLTASTGVSW